MGYNSICRGSAMEKKCSTVPARPAAEIRAAWPHIGGCCRPRNDGPVLLAGVVVSAMCFAACDGDIYESYVPDRARFTVEDGTTNQGPNVPFILMGDGVGQGGESDDVATLTRLQTFPERGEVAMAAVGFPQYATVDGGQISSYNPIGSSYGVVQVTPLETLSDRWYLVGVIALPAGMVWWSGYRFYQAADGFVGVRFRVGSQPSVLSVGRQDDAGRHQDPGYLLRKGHRRGGGRTVA